MPKLDRQDSRENHPRYKPQTPPLTVDWKIPPNPSDLNRQPIDEFIKEFQRKQWQEIERQENEIARIRKEEAKNILKSEPFIPNNDKVTIYLDQKIMQQKLMHLER